MGARQGHPMHAAWGGGMHPEHSAKRYVAEETGIW